MTQNALNSRLKKITVIASLILFSLVLIIVIQYIRLGNLKAEAKKLEETKANYEQQINDLNEGNAERGTRSYVEQYARDEMGLIREGETVYNFK